MALSDSVLKKINDELRPEDVYVVGGAVRDRLLKRPLWDMDLVTPYDPSALAEKVARLMEGKSFVLDDKFKIYRIHLKVKGVKSGHRTFVNTDVRCPDLTPFQIDFSQMVQGQLDQDLDRRDYTINSMAVPLTAWLTSHWHKSIIDRHKGLVHLRKKKLIPVLKSMIDNDPLRILRLFRIGAELQFSVPEPTQKLIRAKRHLATKPSPERIRDEFLKFFSATPCHPYLALMDQCGVLEVFLPEVKALRKTAHSYYGKDGVLHHSLQTVQILEDLITNLKSWFPRSHKKMRAYMNENRSGYPRSAHLKWGALLHDIGKPETAEMRDGRLRFFDHEYRGAEKIPTLGKRFRWATDEVDRYARLVRHHMRPGNLAAQKHITDKALHRFFRDLGDDAIGMLLISLADHLTYLTPHQREKRSSAHELLTLKMINRYYNQKQKVLPPRLLDGYDIMKAFRLKPSPLIGTLLTELTEAQSEGHIKTKEAALQYLKTVIEKMEPKALSKT